jgi:hypothetical protein
MKQTTYPCTSSNRSLRAAFLIALAGLSAPHCEAQLISSYIREQVGTLPKGRFMISALGIQAGVGQVFDDGGAKQALSNNFNQNVTFQQITQDDPARSNLLSGLFQAYGLNLQGSSGRIEGQLVGRVNGTIPVVGYGITDRIGVYLNVPILTFQIQTAYRFVPSAQTSQFLSTLQQNNQGSVANEFIAAMNTSLESRLYQTQYDYNPALNRSYLGDLQVSLMSVLQESTPRQGGAAIQGIAVLPTAQDRDIRDLYGLRAGDRRFGLGARGMVETRISSGFSWFNSAQGVFLFPSTQARRFPGNPSDQLNAAVSNSAEITGGARLNAQTQVRYSFPKWISLNAGMGYAIRMQEGYAANDVPPESLSIASARSQMSLASAFGSVDLNSIPSFLEGKFLFPAVFELGAGIPLAGRNSFAEPVVQIQGTMFF